ncbi:MAG: autotransporter domain-containing protein [Cellvibrio sp.]
MNFFNKTTQIASLRTHRHRFFIATIALVFSAGAYAAAPTAVNDSRTIPVNSSITLNPIANDFDSDGDAIAVVSVTTSNNASVTLNSDGSVFYVPNKDFQGVDTFNYTIRETQTTAALTATATVTVNVSDSNFVAASTGDNNRSLAEAMDVVCTKLRESSDSELGAGRRNLLERCNALDAMAENDPDALNAAFRQIAPEETIALMRVTSESTRAQTSAVSQRIGQLQAGNNSFTLNGMAARNIQSGGGAGDAEPIWSAIGFFASFQHEVAEKDMTTMESGYESGGNTLTLGADYRFNEKWVMGGAVGFSQNDLDYSNQGGKLDTEVTSFIIFNSYSFEKSSLEMQLGYASTSFDSVRNMEYYEGDTLISDTMRGTTGGDQLLFNSQFQWEWNRNALSVFPFMRFDYLQNKVDGYGENGGGGLPMVIGKQSTEQMTLGAGVQTTYVFNKNWGVLIPSFKATLLSEVSSAYDPITARFAYDPDPDNMFTMKNDGEDKSFAQIGIGSSFIFKGGVSGFLQYQQLVGYNNLSAYQIQGGIRYEF